MNRRCISGVILMCTVFLFSCGNSSGYESPGDKDANAETNICKEEELTAEERDALNTEERPRQEDEESKENNLNEENASCVEVETSRESVPVSSEETKQEHESEQEPDLMPNQDNENSELLKEVQDIHNDVYERYKIILELNYGTIDVNSEILITEDGWYQEVIEPTIQSIDDVEKVLRDACTEDYITARYLWMLNGKTYRTIDGKFYRLVADSAGVGFITQVTSVIEKTGDKLLYVAEDDEAAMKFELFFMNERWLIGNMEFTWKI